MKKLTATKTIIKYTFGKDSMFNIPGKIILSPLICLMILFYFLMEFLFCKET